MYTLFSNNVQKLLSVIYLGLYTEILFVHFRSFLTQIAFVVYISKPF